MWVAALAQQMAVRPIRELCDELLGPLDHPGIPPTALDHSADLPTQPAADGAPLEWCPTVLGVSKRTLLREVVLPALATNRALQRILAEYLEQLGALA
jgi:protein HIRA/HIR1